MKIIYKDIFFVTQAIPWFPDEAVMIPFCLMTSLAADNVNNLLKAPRILKDPVNCSFSKMIM